jgi:hypothetical protein
MEQVSPVKQMTTDMLQFVKSIFTPFGATIFCLAMGLYILSLMIAGSFTAWKFIIMVLFFVGFGVGVYLTWFRGSSNEQEGGNYYD